MSKDIKQAVNSSFLGLFLLCTEGWKLFCFPVACILEARTASSERVMIHEYL